LLWQTIIAIGEKIALQIRIGMIIIAATETTKIATISEVDTKVAMAQTGAGPARITVRATHIVKAAMIATATIATTRAGATADARPITIGASRSMARQVVAQAVAAREAE